MATKARDEHGVHGGLLTSLARWHEPGRLDCRAYWPDRGLRILQQTVDGGHAPTDRSWRPDAPRRGARSAGAMPGGASRAGMRRERAFVAGRRILTRRAMSACRDFPGAARAVDSARIARARRRKPEIEAPRGSSPGLRSGPRARRPSLLAPQNCGRRSIAPGLKPRPTYSRWCLAFGRETVIVSRWVSALSPSSPSLANHGRPGASNAPGLVVQSVESNARSVP
jgi:hypothetical protein